MSEEFLKHIFEPFVQEHSDARTVYSGTGLGMSIVKKIIDRMNGTIVVTSKEGEGSTFQAVDIFSRNKPGNFVKADDEVQEEESIVQLYEHQHRDGGESVYREAARAFAGGDGTENSPYEISSVEELQYLAELLSDPENRSTEYRTQNYILTADISLNDASDYEKWGTERPEYDWRSIGAEATFTGVFDGNGHTISGLYQNKDLQEDNADASSDHSGLFADVYCATIKNLNLTDVYIEVSGDASKA